MLSIFKPPIVNDEISLKARNFFKLVWGSVFLVTVICLADIIILPMQTFRWVIAFVLFDVVSLALIWLNNKGLTRFASMLYVLNCGVLVFVFALTAGGIKAPIVLFFTFIVLVSGLLLGWKEGLIAGILSVLAALALVLIEFWGFLPEMRVVHSSLSIWTVYVLLIALLSLLQFLWFGNLSKALITAKSELALRTHAEMDLRRSEAFRERVFESSLIPIIVMDATSYRFIDCNQAAVDIYNYKSIDEVIGKTPVDVSAKTQYDGSPSFEKSKFYIQDALNNSSVVFEWKHQRPNGEFWDAKVHLISFKVEQKQLIQFTLFDITESKRIDHALSSLATSYAGLTGQLFFEATSKHMATELGLDYVYVGKLNASKDEVEVLGGYAFDKPMSKMSYSLVNTPCSDVLNSQPCSFSTGIQQLYPNDMLLKQMGIESYFGAPILDVDRTPVGIMVALHSKPIHNIDRITNFFNIFLDRITAEVLRLKAQNALVAEINERKNVEKSLVEKELRIRSISNNFNAGMIYQAVVDNDGTRTFTYLSDSVKQLYGITPEEGMADSSLIYGKVYVDDLPLLMKTEEEAVKSFSTFKCESRMVNTDGSLRWSLITSSPNKLANGSICWDGIEFVITDRKQAEESFRISAAQLKANLDNTPDVAIQWFDVEGKILFWNPASEKLFGFISDEAIGKTLGDLILSREDEAEFKQMLKIIEETKTPYGPYETSIIRKDKVVRWMQSTVFSFPLDDKTTGFACMDVDISNRKAIENELRESEELFKNLIQFAPTPITLIDFDDKFLLANRAFYDLVNLKETEVIGKTPDEMGFIVDVTTQELARQEMIQRNQIDNLELTVKLPNGDVAEFLYSSRIINWKNRPAVFGTSVNITEINRIKTELEKHRNNLEALIIERTKELNASVVELFSQKNELLNTINKLNETQEQLIQSEKMASLGVLSAGIAHEINNPLNFINGGLLGLKQYFEEQSTEHQDEINPLLEAIETGLFRAAEIVSSLNHYSRQDEVKNNECNIHDIIDNCLVILQSKLKNKVEVTKQYDAGQAVVVGNEGKLHQVFLNVITNAEQSIIDNGIISIVTRIKSNFIYIAVSDTGCGIDVENIQKVVDPFFTTKAPGKGTGLGLSITYSILQEHNGTIEFNSQPDTGTTVTVKLPLPNQKINKNGE